MQAAAASASDTTKAAAATRDAAKATPAPTKARSASDKPTSTPPAPKGVVDGILHTNAATQTKRTNVLFKRLTAYARGHANLSTEKEGSIRSGVSLDQLSHDAQRALCCSHMCLFSSLSIPILH